MKILWRVVVVLVLVAAVLGIGVYAYNVGMAQGVAQQVQIPAGASVQMPYFHFGYPFFGPGFGFLGCLIPLFLLFVFFGSLRALFWHGPLGWRYMHRRHWGWQDENGKDIPPFFEEWHRRAHAKPEDETSEK